MKGENKRKTARSLLTSFNDHHIWYSGGRYAQSGSARTHVQIAKDLSPSIGTYERQPASDLRYPSLTCLDTADARKELRGLLLQVEGAGLRLGSTGTLCGKRRCQRICARRSSAALERGAPGTVTDHAGYPGRPAPTGDGA
jgi:hypothetical protein